MKRNNTDVAASISASICGGIALLGFGMLAAYAEAEELSRNPKGYYHCTAPSANIIRRSTIIANGIDPYNDGQIRPFINEYPHRRYSESELREGDIVFCTLTKCVYMITQ